MHTCVSVYVYKCSVFVLFCFAEYTLQLDVYNIHACVSVYVYFCSFLFCFAEYLTAGCLTLCFSSIQAARFEQQPVDGPAAGHFFRAFVASVSLRVCRG